MRTAQNVPANILGKIANRKKKDSVDEGFCRLTFVQQRLPYKAGRRALGRPKSLRGSICHGFGGLKTAFIAKNDDNNRNLHFHVCFKQFPAKYSTFVPFTCPRYCILHGLGNLLLRLRSSVFFWLFSSIFGFAQNDRRNRSFATVYKGSPQAMPTKI